MHNCQTEGRVALTAEISKLESRGEDLLAADPPPTDAISDWLQEARLVVLSLNVLTQRRHFREYSAAKQDIDAAARNFDRTEELEYARDALVVVKAIHRLARSGRVPVHGD